MHRWLLAISGNWIYDDDVHLFIQYEVVGWAECSSCLLLHYVEEVLHITFFSLFFFFPSYRLLDKF